MSKKIRTSMPDTGRFKRQGFPEAIYAPGKTKQEIIEIAGRLMKGGGPVIATRIEKSLASALIRKFKNAKYYKTAKI